MTEFSDDIDIFAEGMEPQRFEYKLFYIRMPVVLNRDIGDTISCRISVDQYSHCEMVDWYYFHKRDPHRPYRLSNFEDKVLWECEQEVWSWLAEWELVELRPIGPQESEYFATSKLTSDDRR